MIADEAGGTIRFVYNLRFENGVEKRFEINLDAKTLANLNPVADRKPEWTRLGFCQCSNCPLGPETPSCPVAVNLSHLAEEFQASVSYEKVLVTVTSAERTYVKETTLQKALSSLVGLHMVTSGCPIMDKLRPMVPFHLPFATARETVYRAVSMYLTAQYLLKRRGLEADWDLKKLIEIYKAISHVNKGISNRLSQASSKDANVNAVVILHSLGDSLPFFIENGLDEVEAMFSPYLDK